MRAFSFVATLVALASPTVAPVPTSSSPDAAAVAAAFAEARSASDRDAGRLWGIPLYGPMLVVDRQTRGVVANQVDAEGQLVASGDVFVGTIPASIPLANTSVEWAGVRWAMILWPLPDDATERTALLLHESFHRLQPRLGLTATNPGNVHLDSFEGRTLMRLEWRALSAALTSLGASRRRAIADALAFRTRRDSLFASAKAEERALELNEGLAEYTGRVLSSVNAEARVVALLADAETKPSFTRSFAYATGPAYGLLLDARGARWRARIDASFDLAERTGIEYRVASRAESSAAIDRRATRYDGTEVRAAERRREQRRRDSEARSRARYMDGAVLSIPLQHMKISFDPNTLEPLGVDGTVYPTMVISDDWGTLTVTGGALLAADWSRVTVPAPTGQGSSGHEPSSSMSGDGWSLSLADGWAMESGPRPGDQRIVRRTSDHRDR